MNGVRSGTSSSGSPRRVRRRDQRGGDRGVGEPDAEAERGDAGVDQPADVGGAAPPASSGQPHPGREQQLAALEERGGVLELADRDPADRAVPGPPAPASTTQAERRARR